MQSSAGLGSEQGSPLTGSWGAKASVCGSHPKVRRDAVFDFPTARQTDAATAAQGNVCASPGTSPLREGLYPKHVHTTRADPRESQDGVAMILGAFAMRHRYQELTMPVVIMAGAKDRVVGAKQPARLHAQIPHSILRLVPDVGHMLHYAVPEEVAEAIEEVGESRKRVTRPPMKRVYV